MKHIPLTHLIGLIAVVAFFLVSSGYFIGRQQGRGSALKAAVQAYQAREKINETVQNLDPVALCRACSTNAPTSCAGWTRPPAINEPVRLVQVEPALSRWLVATDKFGQKQGCWARAMRRESRK